MIAAVADVEHTARPDGDSVRLVELGFCRWASQARRSFAARAGDVHDRRVGRAVHADAMVLGVGDQDVSLGVGAEMLGAVQGRLAGIPAVPR